MSDDKLVTNLSTSSPSSSIQMTLTNRILSPSDINSSPMSPVKSSSIRRTFNICDILAKPSSSFDDNNNNNKLLITPLDDDDELNGSISDCDQSGKIAFCFCFDLLKK